MKLFLDTANVEEIRQAAELGVICGVTTNPTLIAREGRNFQEVIKEIAQIIDGPISAEVVGITKEEMVLEAKELAKIHKNIIIKIPLIPEGLKAIKVLSSLGIKTNATLIFSVNQAILAANAGATYVSPFIGRLDDISHDGMELVSDICQVFVNYNYETEIIAASVRHPIHVAQSAKLGAHIATVPYKLILQMCKHPLTDLGLENFLKDWEKVKNK
ncbi:MAG: transaldolase [Clostridiaceae bacterium BRH_c20a]|nr:MAG: transaldolase [Clostridiaceae bacterium BRH_c20a]